MAAPKTMSGARAKVGIYNAQTGETKFIGSAFNVSYGVTYDFQPAYVLGRYSAAELAYTAVEVVNISMSSWRSFGHGWHKEAQLPPVQNLLTYEAIELVITDRQQEALGGTDPRIAKIRYVLPTSGAGGYQSRQLSEMTHSYVGLLVDDEDVTNAEHPTAADLP